MSNETATLIVDVYTRLNVAIAMFNDYNTDGGKIVLQQIIATLSDVLIDALIESV